MGKYLVINKTLIHGWSRSSEAVIRGAGSRMSMRSMQSFAAETENRHSVQYHHYPTSSAISHLRVKVTP